MGRADPVPSLIKQNFVALHAIHRILNSRYSGVGLKPNKTGTTPSLLALYR